MLSTQCSLRPRWPRLLSTGVALAGCLALSATAVPPVDPPAPLDLPDEVFTDDTGLIAVADLTRMTGDELADATASIQSTGSAAARKAAGAPPADDGLHGRFMAGLHRELTAQDVERVALVVWDPTQTPDGWPSGVMILLRVRDGVGAAALKARADAFAGGRAVLRGRWACLDLLGTFKPRPGAPERVRAIRAALAAAAAAGPIHAVVMPPPKLRTLMKRLAADVATASVPGADFVLRLGDVRAISLSIAVAPVVRVEWTATLPDEAAAVSFLDAYHRAASAFRLTYPPTAPGRGAGGERGEYDMIFTHVASLPVTRTGATVTARVTGPTIAVDAAARYESMRRMGVVLRGFLQSAADHGGRVPERLSDLARVAIRAEDKSDGVVDLSEYLPAHLANPSTGADPGYVYRKPAGAAGAGPGVRLADLADPARVGVLFEVRDGRIDSGGAVGYADGIVRATPSPPVAADDVAAIAAADLADLTKELPAARAEAARKRQALEATAAEARKVADAKAAVVATRVAEESMNATADALEAEAEAAEAARRYGEAIRLYERHVTEHAGPAARVRARLAALRADPAVRRAVRQERADAECPRLMSMAENYARAGLPDKARPYLRKIIDQHDGTDWAARASAMLAELDWPTK